MVTGFSSWIKIKGAWLVRIITLAMLVLAIGVGSQFLVDAFAKSQDVPNPTSGEEYAGSKMIAPANPRIRICPTARSRAFPTSPTTKEDLPTDKDLCDK